MGKSNGGAAMVAFADEAGERSYLSILGLEMAIDSVCYLFNRPQVGVEE
jgi:hypothetical protein